MVKTEGSILRVALLTRVSTDEQVIRGYSLQAQENALVKYANENSMKIVGIYRDEGHSARKPVLKRPIMLQLLEDVKAGKIDRILFIKLDRWFRNVSEYHAIQAILDKHNVTWQAILEDYNTTTADGRLKVNIMLSVAENEADRTSERIKFVFNAKLEKKEVFFGLPFGYKHEMIDGVRRAVKDPETQHIVEDFFKKALATNVTQAAKEMNAKYNRTHCYKFWRNLITRELYVGIYKGIEDYVPAYITKEEFEILNSKNTITRKVKDNRVYLFSSLLRCPICKSRLGSKYCRSSKKYTHEYLYYRCNGKQVGICDYGIISEMAIEKYLLDNLRSELEKFVISSEAEQNAEKQGKPKKNDVEKLQEKLRRLNVIYFDGNITDQEYAEEAKAIRDQLAEAQAAEIITDKPSNIDAIKALLATDFESLYKTLSKEEQRALWHSVIEEIELEGLKPVGIKLKV